MEHLKADACPNNGTTDDLDPVVTALLTQETFDRAQMAWLMSLAGRWGYEARVDEENHGYPEPSVFVAGDTIKAIDQKAYRRACDAAASLTRPGDYRGGPVAWDESDDMRVAA